jgi:hypothetical protein
MSEVSLWDERSILHRKRTCVSLLEQPLIILVAGSLLVAVAAAMWVQTRHRLAAIALLVAIGGTVAALVLERLVVTSGEEVEATLHALAERLEANDVDGVLRYISPQHEALRQEARSYLRRIRVKSISIKSNLQVTTAPGRPVRSAVARFNAVAAIEGPANWGGGAELTVPRLLVVRFRRGDDRWLVTDYESFDPRGEQAGRGRMR